MSRGGLGGAGGEDGELMKSRSTRRTSSGDFTASPSPDADADAARAWPLWEPGHSWRPRHTCRGRPGIPVYGEVPMSHQGQPALAQGPWGTP